MSPLLRRRIDCCEHKKGLYAQANRSGGPRHRAWLATNDTIFDELDWLYQHQRVDFRRHASAQARDMPCAQARLVRDSLHGPTSRYTRQYAIDHQRIARQMEAEYLSLKKLWSKDKIIAAIVNARNRDDMNGARRNQDHMERIIALERIQSRSKRSRKRSITTCRNAMDARYRRQDPDSGDEGDGGAYARENCSWFRLSD